MAAPTDRSGMSSARNALREHRNELAKWRFEREQARVALAEARRQFDPESPEVVAAENALATAEAEVATQRQDIQTVLASLKTQIQAWLTDAATPTTLDPNSDLARLTQISRNIVLLPVRLETRFDIGASTLKVRIYPDEVFSDIHERTLTPEEKQAGQAYWDFKNENDGSESIELWTQMADRFGVPRAAYIVRAMGQESLPELRMTTPGRAAEAVMPDRWVVLAYKNGVLRKQVVGLPITEPLNLSPDPVEDVQVMTEVADGFTVPDKIAWTVRYDLAKSHGMAVDVTGLAADELATGFDRIVVIGVKTSMDDEDGGQHLIDLLDSHHYARGLALVRQGTPTNNIPGRPTPVTTAQPSGADSFATERRGGRAQVADAPPEFDANVFADYVHLDDAFGVNVFRFVQGTEFQKEQRENNLGAFMNLVLWPVTLGYFMEQMMNPWAYLNLPSGGGAIFSDDTIKKARAFFINHVIARGPAPAFRIGAVPYGVLPALSLSRWAPRTGEDPNFVNTLRRLLPHWQAAARTLPAVTRNSSNPKFDLVNVLRQKASSDTVNVRHSLGVEAVTNIFQLVFVELANLFAAQKRQTDPVLQSLGHADWARARVLGLTFLEAINRFAGALVTATPVEGKLGPGANYIARLADPGLTLAEIQSQDASLQGITMEQPRPLLYLLLRHALLLHAVGIGRRLNLSGFSGLGRVEHEMWSVVTGENRSNVFQVLGGASVFDTIKADSEYKYFAYALSNLAAQSVRDLERMLTETLDIGAHRLDAWVTALATRRLRQNQGDVSDENYWGGYGWVEDVRPTARTTKDVPGLGLADIQPGNAGYIHAPSMRHATPAGILRAGRMAERGDASKYAIELPSERARSANGLVEAIRAGQSLGELLGYEFERGMRKRNVTGTETFILALRKLFPLVGNKSETDGTEPADRIAGRNVVDGKKLREKKATIPWGTGGLPPATPPTNPGRAAIEAEITRLDGIVDGLGDLLISETVLQVARGDIHAVQATVTAFSSGENPPEPEIAQSPSVGMGISHRVVLVMEGNDPQTSWPRGVSPRSDADAFVDAWAGSLLGDPAGLKVTIDYVEANQPKTLLADVSMLQLAALDFVALSQGKSVAGEGSILDRRFRALLFATHPTASEIEIAYDAPAPPGRSIPQALEMARAIGNLLGGSRETTIADLARPDDQLKDDSQEMLDVEHELGELIVAHTSELSDTIAGLDGPNKRAALLSAARFVADAYPDPQAVDEEIEAAALATRSELARRLGDAQDAIVPDGTNAAKIAGAIAAFRFIYGRNTLAILPAMVPQRGFEVGQSLTALGNDTSTADRAPERYLHQAMRVRERLFPWRRLGLYVGAMGRPMPRVSAVQLPFVEGEPWVGSTVPAESRLSLLLVSATGQTVAPNPGQPWRGLVLDEWTETIPSNTVETGVAFHYDSQNSEAPQAILTCVHSGQGTTWSFSELAAIVTETIDLVQIRPVDSDMLHLGQLTPGLLLAANLENKTVSTLFPGNTLENPPVVTG
jgi:hypothetical protein